MNGFTEPVTKAMQKDILDFMREGISDEEIAKLYPNHNLKDYFPVWHKIIGNEMTEKEPEVKAEKPKKKEIIIARNDSPKQKPISERVYTKDEEELIRDMFAHSVSYEKIGKKFGVSAEEMKLKCKKLGLNPTTRTLTEAEVKEKQRKYFGRHLRTARENLGFKQGEVEEKLGLTRSSLSQYENGKWYPDKPEILDKICKFYKIKNVETLFFSKEVYLSYMESKKSQVRKEEKEMDAKITPVAQAAVQKIKDEETFKQSENQTKQEDIISVSDKKEEVFCKDAVKTLSNNIYPENIAKLERIAKKCGVGVFDILNGVIDKLDETRFKAKVKVEVEF